MKQSPSEQLLRRGEHDGVAQARGDAAYVLLLPRGGGSRELDGVWPQRVLRRVVAHLSVLVPPPRPARRGEEEKWREEVGG